MTEKTYTHTPIPGKMPDIMLPKGCALILEGGGTRGFYSSGVMDAFIEAGLMFPYIIGVSAGAANALSYISGQIGRSRQVVEHYVGDPRYVSRRNLLLHRSLFGMDFAFHQVPQKHIFLDWDIFAKQDVRFLTGAMDCQSGQSVWFEKQDLDEDLTASIASCSIPFVSRKVHFRGYQLLDGGTSDPIPIEKSLEDGNCFHVVVLTRNEGYRKTPFKYQLLPKLFYRKYPAVAEAVLRQHETYNRQLELVEQLEREGKALIIRPLQPLKVDRTVSDTSLLLELYDEGVAEGREKIAEILAAADKISAKQD